MYENNYYTQEGYGSYSMVETVGRYTARTFLWMFAGLAVTFGVAIAGYITGFSFRLLFNSFTYIGLLIAQIAVVLVALRTGSQPVCAGGSLPVLCLTPPSPA